MHGRLVPFSWLIITRQSTVVLPDSYNLILKLHKHYEELLLSKNENGNIQVNIIKLNQCIHRFCEGKIQGVGVYALVSQVIAIQLKLCNIVPLQNKMHSHDLRQLVDNKSVVMLLTDLLQVDCQSFVSTGLLQVVSTS